MEIDLLDNETDKQSKNSIRIVLGCSIALLLFFIIGITFPVKDKVLGLFYQKPESHAAIKQISCTACRADINKNGVVGQADYANLLLCMGKKVRDTNELGTSCLNADINGDGVVNMQDEECLQSQFGHICK